MSRLNIHRHARFAIWLAAIAVLLAALSPTSNAWRLQGQPRLFAELCTSMGFVRIAIDDKGAPTRQIKHGTDCSWCLSPASLLALSGVDAQHIPSSIGREPALALVLKPVTLARHHAFAWAQAPPHFPD